MALFKVSLEPNFARVRRAAPIDSGHLRPVESNRLIDSIISWICENFKTKKNPKKCVEKSTLLCEYQIHEDATR